MKIVRFLLGLLSLGAAVILIYGIPSAPKHLITTERSALLFYCLMIGAAGGYTVVGLIACIGAATKRIDFSYELNRLSLTSVSLFGSIIMFLVGVYGLFMFNIH